MSIRSILTLILLTGSLSAEEHEVNIMEAGAQIAKAFKVPVGIILGSDTENPRIARFQLATDLESSLAGLKKTWPKYNFTKESDRIVIFPSEVDLSKEPAMKELEVARGNHSLNWSLNLLGKVSKIRIVGPIGEEGGSNEDHKFAIRNAPLADALFQVCGVSAHLWIQRDQEIRVYSNSVGRIRFPSQVLVSEELLDNVEFRFPDPSNSQPLTLEELAKNTAKPESNGS